VTCKPQTAECKVCGRVCRNIGARATHMRSHTKPLRPALVPDGAGFLKRVLLRGDNPPDLTELSKFSQILAGSRPYGRKGKQRRVNEARVLYCEEHPEETARVIIDVPATLHAPALRLGYLAAVPTSTVYVALVIYGLSLLSRELRDNRRAPMVRGPKAFTDRVAGSQVVDLTVYDSQVKTAGDFPGYTVIDD